MEHTSFHPNVLVVVLRMGGIPSKIAGQIMGAYGTQKAEDLFQEHFVQKDYSEEEPPHHTHLFSLHHVDYAVCTELPKILGNEALCQSSN
jgi:hypothetical protein